MASSEHSLSEFDLKDIPGAEFLKFGIVVSDYNLEITSKLLEGCLSTLVQCDAVPENINIIHVPGAYELVSGARLLLRKHKQDAVICLGCVIKGDTDHDVYINKAVADGIMQLNLNHKTPVIFGLLTPNTRQQAIDRAGGKHGNKGVEAAVTAIKMADLYDKT
jgi:6,7-dimethyl-8-ribityllumazine synthase